MYTLLFIVLVTFYASCDAAEFTECGYNNAVKITMRQFPDPIILKKGGDIAFKFTVDVKRKVGSVFTVKVEVQKKMLFWIPVPCVSGYGSCTYTMNCPKIYKYGYVGKCPLPVGSHDVNDVKMQLPSLSFPSFMTSGNYWARATIRDANTKETVGCGETYFSVASA